VFGCFDFHVLPFGNISYYFSEVNRKVTVRERPGMPCYAHGTQTGDIPVSTPEWTAIDLIRFQKHYGSMDAVATVLTEMAEVLDAKKLAVAARREPCNACLQRLGWMLDFLGCQKLTGPMSEEVQGRKLVYVPLNPSIKRRCEPRDGTWSIIVNEKPEADSLKVVRKSKTKGSQLDITPRKGSLCRACIQVPGPESQVFLTD
jgi:hypothetical protein